MGTIDKHVEFLKNILISERENIRVYKNVNKNHKTYDKNIR